MVVSVGPIYLRRYACRPNYRAQLMRFLIALAVGLLSAGCATTGTDATTVDQPPLGSIELALDGLGDVQFGVDADTVVSEISALFGGPDHDSDWIAAEPNIYGSCPGELMRAIGWGSLVAILIDDGSSELGGWFYTYTYGYDYSLNAGGIDPRGLGLTTPEGIGLGTTNAELRATYGDAVEISGDETLDVWSFVAQTAGFRGLLSGAGDADEVTLIEPLAGCD